MKTLRRLLVALIVLAGLVGGGWWLLRPQPVTVTAQVVTRGPVEDTVANTRAGTVNALRRAKLAPGTGGPVAALQVKEGDRVTAGQVLMELWNDDLRAQLGLARSEAERAAARSEEAGLRAELAEREAQRQVELREREVSAEERTDRAVSEAKAVRAAHRAAEAEIRVRQDQIRVIEAQIERTILRAPFAGVVAEVNGEVGEFVTPSPVGIPTPPAVDLIDDTSLYVTAPIDEVDATRVRVGMSVRITLDAFGKRSFAGQVRRIAPYVMDREKQARTVDVEVDFVDAPGDLVLLAGYSADVEILVAVRADTLRVPTEAVRDGDRVLVIAGDGTLEERIIATGLANWRFIEVTGGLAAGERIVLNQDRTGVEAGAQVQVEAKPGAGSDVP